MTEEDHAEGYKGNIINDNSLKALMMKVKNPN